MIIYHDEEFKEINRTDPKLDWVGKYTSPGMVKYSPRKDSPKWEYVYYGETKEDVCAHVNKHLLAEIADLQQRVEYLKSMLVSVV